MAQFGKASGESAKRRHRCIEQRQRKSRFFSDGDQQALRAEHERANIELRIDREFPDALAAQRHQVLSNMV